MENLYLLPKEILIKIICTIREDTIKEMEEKHENYKKDLRENGTVGEQCTGCHKVFPAASIPFRSRLNPFICQNCKIWEDVYLS